MRVFVYNLFLFVLLSTSINSSGSQQIITFPKAPKFLFGTATAAYQIEGAWNVSGKGENIWDYFTHRYPERIEDRSNGDVACDSYHKFREDIKLLKDLGVDFYRFSLSWSRILPTGRGYKVNPDGIRYYNEVIDELLKNGIAPMVTIFHWDTPQPLQELGGFSNEQMVVWFEEYVRVVFDNFGDRVKMWITFNEPRQTCLLGMGEGLLAPGVKLAGIGEYLCTHNLLKSHARAWHIYNEEYRKVQQGKVGITLDAVWTEPVTSEPKNIEAAERLRLFLLGWFSDPIFGENGDYPQAMKDQVDLRSLNEGFKSSRLPKFTKEEIKYIRGTYDFMGVNVYTSILVRDLVGAAYGEPSYKKDVKLIICQDPSWPKTSSKWLRVEPCGVTKILTWINERYKHDPNLEIYITENGYSDKGYLNDTGRINYYTDYLAALKEAMNQGVNIKGYTAWSLLDNFEWIDGYKRHFGLYHVDFKDPDRKRTPKASAQFYKQLLATRVLKTNNNTTVPCEVSKTVENCILQFLKDSILG